MKKHGIKKTLGVLLAISLLMIGFLRVVLAENDAMDLGYRLQITVTDENGIAKNNFEIGELIYVKMSLAYTGAGRAPVYGLQGELHYDPYVIQNIAVEEQSDVKARGTDGQINFVFLDMTGQGKSDAMLENIGVAVFMAKSSGTVNLYGENFMVTNKDASLRYIDDSEEVTVIVGTGVKEITKELLEANIVKAENMLAECMVTDESNPGIYYPDFWVTTQTAQALQTAIDQAKLVFNHPEATKEEIQFAVAQLDLAVKQFEESKIYGPRRFSSGSSSSSTVTVSATVQGGNGKIASGFETQKCRMNTSCTIRMQPDEGYETEYVYINGQQFPGSDIFTIPNVSRDTTVVVTFCKKPPFTDMSYGDWFYVSARYVYNNGIFQGTSEKTFSPDLPMSRAMLATVLYRMEGRPSVRYAGTFTDVEKDSWYTNAIEWASEKNIVKGHGGGIFAPDDFITREQIAVMLRRYAQWKTMASEVNKTELHYTDAANISDYALEAITWAVETGLMKGNTETTINPQGIATRAELAAMMQRFMEWIVRK